MFTGTASGSVAVIPAMHKQQLMQMILTTHKLVAELLVELPAGILFEPAAGILFELPGPLFELLALHRRRPCDRLRSRAPPLQPHPNLRGRVLPVPPHRGDQTVVSQRMVLQMLLLPRNAPSSSARLVNGAFVHARIQSGMALAARPAIATTLE